MEYAGETWSHADTWGQCPILLIPVSHQTVPGIASNEWCWCCLAVVLASSTQTDIARKGFEILCHSNRTVCTTQLHSFLLFLSSLAFTNSYSRNVTEIHCYVREMYAHISCYAIRCLITCTAYSVSFTTHSSEAVYFPSPTLFQERRPSGAHLYCCTPTQMCCLRSFQ